MTRLAATLYLDSSAIVKLVVRETETDQLIGYLADAQLIVSEIAYVEVPRAARLKTGLAETLRHAEAVLERFYAVALDDELKAAAARLGPPRLRTLDAIHLVSALRLQHGIEAIVAYDRRLKEAAEDAGFRVASPGVGEWASRQ